ncbi:hypothetical protein [Thermococcus peptonophilus]|uniref:hypothetical protein n=1 Tax=Thermococcus peptonophilus TaxID=53952 RepID=UPI0006D28864
MKELPKVPLDIKKIIAEEDPVRKAYFLGYFIAYYGHTDWVGIWRELRDSIFESAEESGVLREAIEAYRRGGKKEGARDRELAIARGLYRPLPTGGIFNIKWKRYRKSALYPSKLEFPRYSRLG